MKEGRVALFPEGLVVVRVDAAHGLHHLLAELHRRRQRLGVAAQDVAEVHVEQAAGLGQQQVVQVAVTHAQKIGDDAVARCEEGRGRLNRDIGGNVKRVKRMRKKKKNVSDRVAFDRDMSFTVTEGHDMKIQVIHDHSWIALDSVS